MRAEEQRCPGCIKACHDGKRAANAAMYTSCAQGAPPGMRRNRSLATERTNATKPRNARTHKRTQTPA
eukprot:5796956-Lingulodinium_polyedra.AAC.1